MTDRANNEAGRFFYFRAHNHPMGWGVSDSKSGGTVAFGDKNICAAVAAILNDDPDGAAVLKGWPEAFDKWLSSPTVKRLEYDYETGDLVTNNQRGKSRD